MSHDHQCVLGPTEILVPGWRDSEGMAAQVCSNLFASSTSAEILASYNAIQSLFGDENVVERFLSTSISNTLLVRHVYKIFNKAFNLNMVDISYTGHDLQTYQRA